MEYYAHTIFSYIDLQRYSFTIGDHAYTLSQQTEKNSINIEYKKQFHT